MTDVVIPLGFGSTWYNHEIRFALRSVERYLKGAGKVHLIGKCPEFIHNVEFVPFIERNTEAIPDRNIANKLLVACGNPEISDPFLYMNDDHYLLDEFHVEQFPNYYYNTLSDYCGKRKQLDGYGRRAFNTLKWLHGNGLTDYFYDIHYPMLIEKQPFMESVGSLDWSKTHDGWIIKSIYGNYAKVPGVQENDYKSLQPPPPQVKVFSSYPRVKASVQRFLLERFPTMSSYEKTDIK